MMPTTADWNAATARAAAVKLRLLIVAGRHIEIISAESGALAWIAGDWAAVLAYLDAMESNEWRMAA